MITDVGSEIPRSGGLSKSFPFPHLPKELLQVFIRRQFSRHNGVSPVIVWIFLAYRRLTSITPFFPRLLLCPWPYNFQGMTPGWPALEKFVSAMLPRAASYLD